MLSRRMTITVFPDQLYCVCSPCSLALLKPPITYIYSILSIKGLNFANNACLCKYKALHFSYYGRILLGFSPKDVSTLKQLRQIQKS